ncbi:MAG TPA: nucleotidyltransferase family protein [Candidatus Saccharimonadales bacterium]|nr:nucleotidyltransferase family protein [Candidatus Saccharimonadales bacterium]
MRAMILAAGLGTRLRPLTDTIPKALVELEGRTLLEITLDRLKSFNITEVIINTHHYAEKIQSYLHAKNNFGLSITISEEEVLLDTGGGLRKASWFFLEDESRLDEPFVLHNVDILTDIDLRAMCELHQQQNAAATLAVQSRDTSRPLLFAPSLQLAGRRNGRNAPVELVLPTPVPGAPASVRPAAGKAAEVPALDSLAFSGIHLISPRLLPQISETGIFSIIPTYLRLAATQKILAFRADHYYWRDLGRPADLVQAAGDLQHHLVR